MQAQNNSLQGCRLLIVDDEPVLSLTFAVVLRRAGATVFTAANGREALDLLSRETADAMLCDQRMPVMDGQTLLRTLHAAGRSIPTVLFVNGVDDEDTAALEALNVRHMISKPIPPQVLLDTFTSLVADLSDKRALG